MNAYIQLEGVHKVIDGNSVLQRIDLQLEQRLIYGFRAISGLIHPSEGTIMVAGKQIVKDISFPENLCLLIEHPGFIPEYTGLKNLDLLALIQGK